VNFEESEGESELSLTIHGTRPTEESQHHCFQMIVSFTVERISRDDCPIDEEISEEAAETDRNVLLCFLNRCQSTLHFKV
jgi:hypothetical protein